MFFICCSAIDAFVDSPFVRWAASVSYEQVRVLEKGKQPVGLLMASYHTPQLDIRKFFVVIFFVDVDVGQSSLCTCLALRVDVHRRGRHKS